MKRFWGMIGGVLLMVISLVLANSSPTQPILINPVSSQVLGEITNITWLQSTDPDNDPLHYEIDYSPNNGGEWYSLVSEAGRQRYFAENVTEKTISFAGSKEILSFVLPFDQVVAYATLNVTGVPTPIPRSWNATTASYNLSSNLTRIWVNLSGKLSLPSTLTGFTLGLDPEWNSPQDIHVARVCAANNLSDSSCPQHLQDAFANCNAPPYCQDPVFIYALDFRLNVSLATPGQILMFETALIDPSGYDVATLYGNVSSVRGLQMAAISQENETYYPDAAVRLEYALDSFPSNLSLDIGDDGVIEHNVPYEINRSTSPLLVQLNKRAINGVVASCNRPQGEKFCAVNLALNATNGIMTLHDLRIYYNITSQVWLTQFVNRGDSYGLRIRASDDINFSRYATATSLNISYDPVECEQIPTNYCNITRSTKFFNDVYYVNAIAILNNNTDLDCNGARLITANPQSTPDIGLSFARTRNITIKNCIFEGYHTAITSKLISQDAYPQPVANISIADNEFRDIDYVAIELSYLNRTVRGANPLTTFNTEINISNNKINMSSSSNIAYFGILIERFFDANIFGNEIFNDVNNRPYSDNAGYITLNNAPRAKVLFNKIRNSRRGISIYGVSRINETAGNTIVLSNDLLNMEDGIFIDGFNNIVLNNTFKRNNQGVRLSSLALNNYVYANRMIDNRIQAIDSRNNTFQLLTTGNLWNDYMNDTQGCFDVRLPIGRCDNPYNLSPISRDRYPIRWNVSFEVRLPPDYPGAPDDPQPEPVLLEIPPVITSVNAPQYVIAGNIANLSVFAIGINKLEGLNIIVDEQGNQGQGSAVYLNNDTYGISDPSLSYDISSDLFSRQGTSFSWRTNASSVGIHSFVVSVSDGIYSKSRSVNFEVLPRSSMLNIEGSPRVGNTVNFTILEPQQANRTYVLALSFGNAPGIPLGDGRVIPLSYDPLMSLSVQYPSYIGLSNSIGSLDSQGRSIAQWTIPNIPQLAGITVYAAFITIDSALPFPQIITSISPALPVTLQV